VLTTFIRKLRHRAVSSAAVSARPLDDLDLTALFNEARTDEDWRQASRQAALRFGAAH
jgi:hypothetical protein